MKIMLMAGLMITSPAIIVAGFFFGRSMMIPAIASLLINLVPFVVAGLLMRGQDGVPHQEPVEGGVLVGKRIRFTCWYPRVRLDASRRFAPRWLPHPQPASPTAEAIDAVHHRWKPSGTLATAARDPRSRGATPIGRFPRS